MKPGKEPHAAREPRVGHPCSDLLGVTEFASNPVGNNQT